MSLSLIFLCGGVVGMTLSFNMPQTTVPDDAMIPSPCSILHAVQDDVPPDINSSTPNRAESVVDEAQNTSQRSVRSASSRLSSLVSPRIPRPMLRSSLSDVRFGADDIEEGVSQRASATVGIAAALFNGIWGGANLVPSHFSPLGGVRFVISFATGALIANAVLVVGYALLSRFWWKCPLPSPQLRVMALPGFFAGVLWSTGNFCSLYAVSTVGQGIGYSLVQSCVIVSGMWGILYYRELSGRPVIYWFFCCLVCMLGVVGLALEKKA